MPESSLPLGEGGGRGPKSNNMKRTLQIILSLFVALPMLSQTHDNRLYLTVGEVTENNQVELSLHLENPSIALTAVELYVTLPDGATLAAGSLAARAVQHTLTEGAVEGKHFVSIASSSLTFHAWRPITITSSAS